MFILCVVVSIIHISSTNANVKSACFPLTYFHALFLGPDQLLHGKREIMPMDDLLATNLDGECRKGH